jgi:diacylglycerol kinase
VIQVHPSFERFFGFVDYSGEGLGRLAQEERRLRKRLNTTAV